MKIAAMSSVLLSVLCLLTLAGCATSMGLQVSIMTDPPAPPYPAAIWIHFACHVENAIGTVFHNWTAFCGRVSPPLIIGRIDDNEDNHGEFTLRVRSTPLLCLDTILCMANDSIGQTGNATWHIGSDSITGAGLWGQFGPFYNNSVLVADSSGQINSIHCHSSSFSQDVGQWISPAGRDITENHNDKFVVIFNNGPNYQSSNTFQLQDPLTNPFSAADQGVYSCVVPDNNGVMQTLHIGIYPRGYQGALQISSVSLTSRNPVVINCASTGYPPSLVIWFRSGEQLTASDTHQITSVLTNRLTSDYDNLLTINQPINEAKAIYVCSVRNAEYEPTNTSFEVTVEEYHIGLYAIGDNPQITCTLRNHSNTQWLNEIGNPVSSPNNPLDFLALNDSIHGSDYYCRGYNITTSSVIIDDIILRFKVFILIPDSAIQASATPSDGNTPPLLGQHYALNCRAVKTSGGLMNSPQPQWAHMNGTPITEGNGISLSTSTVNGGPLVLSFSPLDLSHAGSYQCRAILSSPALDMPLIITDIFNITITLPTPEVSINTFSDTHGTILPGSTFMLQCDATVSTMLVDVAITVQFTWKNAHTGTVLRNSSEIGISNVRQTTPLNYQSMLIVSGISADSAYVCEARVELEDSSSLSHVLPSREATSLPVNINITEMVCRESLQIMFGEVNDCNSWRSEDTMEKTSDIITSLVEQINEQCPECQTMQQAITNTEFSCNEDNLKIVTFQAQILGIAHCNTSQEVITKWAQSGEAVITVGTSRLIVEPDCTMLAIPGMGCSSADDDKGGSVVAIGAGVGGAVGLLLIAIIIVVTVISCVVCCKKNREPTFNNDSKVFSNPILQPRVQRMTPITSSPTRPPVHHQTDWLQPTVTDRYGMNMSSNRNLRPPIERNQSVDSDGYISMHPWVDTEHEAKNDTPTTTHSDHMISRPRPTGMQIDRHAAQHKYVNIDVTRYKDDAKYY